MRVRAEGVDALVPHDAAFKGERVAMSVILLGVYSVPHEELASRLQLPVNEVRSEHLKVLETALEPFGANKLDFVDCLLAAYNEHLDETVVSFDRKLNRLLKKTP